MTINILEHIPNWKRFIELYNPSTELIDAFTESISSISDIELRNTISKKINLELGILLLSHREIDQKKMGEILSITGGNV